MHQIKQLKYFLSNFSKLQPFEDIQSSICGECCRFLLKVDGFKDHCLKADQMFREILQHDNISDVNLQSIRVKYGFDSEEIVSLTMRR